jgi:hypothetical protein
MLRTEDVMRLGMTAVLPVLCGLVAATLPAHAKEKPAQEKLTQEKLTQEKAPQAQTITGAYRGMFVCEKMPAAPDILRAPIDVAIDGGSVHFARPIFTWNGRRVVGSEIASGTLDGDGKVRATSTWFLGGVNYQGEYSGTLTASGGTLSGTQQWQGARGGSRRTCTVALVPAPRPRQAARSDL